MASPEQPSDAKEPLPTKMCEEFSANEEQPPEAKEPQPKAKEELSTDDSEQSPEAEEMVRKKRVFYNNSLSNAYSTFQGTKWYYIGMHFEVPTSQLDAIEKNNPNDIDGKLKDMIKKWLELGEGCTWGAVYDALRHPTVGHKSIAEKLKKWLSTPAEERKRKATSQYSGQSKKPKLDESPIKVRSGPECPSVISGTAAAGTKDHAYFASGFKIHEFDMKSKYWREFECPNESFGLVVIENELVSVGGLDKSGVSTSTVCNFSIENKKWKESKFPPMNKPRVNPQVVVANKYLIALSGWVKEGDRDLPMLSVEVLDCEKCCWYSNDNISLPEELKNMKWLSACICNKDIYIAARHNDPDFYDTLSKITDNECDSDSDMETPDEHHLYPDEAYPVYSLFRCPVDILIEAAEEKSENGKHVWQRIEHPHPSVYENKHEHEGGLSEYNDRILSSLEDSDPCEHLDNFETEYNCYGVCCFTLCCIADKLIAVGCNHIESISHEDLDDALYSAYQSYREVNDDQWQFYIHGKANIEVYFDGNTIDEECHIYVYDTEEDSWKRVKSTPRNGESDKQPSVAIVNNQLVVVRKSKTVHIATFPLP